MIRHHPADPGRVPPVFYIYSPTARACFPFPRSLPARSFMPALIRLQLTRARTPCAHTYAFFLAFCLRLRTRAGLPRMRV
ncbi:hypothetical protein DFH09DRAFT_1334901 [Mycena vulgaris]|nr:hypothetical protein DFH09DRAFT_1334901 [Mycena vulgaris]